MKNSETNNPMIKALINGLLEDKAFMEKMCMMADCLNKGHIPDLKIFQKMTLEEQDSVIYYGSKIMRYENGNK